ncbi:MAG: RuBisCO large subunit C-terminal-like domain-containing protein [Candidatus Omnitrophota bacterium]
MKKKCILRERFNVIYQITGRKKDADNKARDICFEQTVEFPQELLVPGFIRDNIVGKIVSFKQMGANSYTAVISYLTEITAGEFTQLLNVIFGNISMKPGIRVLRLELPKSMLSKFKGPRFGIIGLRKLLRVRKRPLLCTALKPLGLKAEELAELAYYFALGGIDIIKDDHGLTNQCFARFKKRVALCAKAVAEANKKTGKKTIYVANITAPYDKILPRIRYAKHAGAGGIMIAPAIVGYDLMRTVAEDAKIKLPILAHPALQGSYLLSPNFGISGYLIFGQLNRLAGADVTIYPNFGGRFKFTRQECREIIAGTQVEMENIKPIFPCPAGGIGLKRVPGLLKFYGRDVIFLIGGGLIKHGKDLIENCRYFLELVK